MTGSSIEESIGYIKSKLESQDEDIKRLSNSLDNLSNKVDNLSDQLAMYRHFTIMLRTTAVGVFIVLTTKFGDVLDWLKNFWRD